MAHSRFQVGARILLVLTVSSIALLWAWLRTNSDRVRQADDWIRLLETGNLDERRLAIGKLEEVPPAQFDSALAATMGALKDQEPPVRVDAVLALARLTAIPPPGSRSPDVDRLRNLARTLLELFRDDPDTSVRAAAATGLGSIREALVRAGARSEGFAGDDPLNPGRLVAALDEGLRREPANRAPILTAIAGMGRLPIVAPQGVVSALDDPSHFVRGQALVALSHFSGGVDRAVPVLLGDIATNPDRFPPDYTAIAGAMHPSPAVVPDLIRGLGSDHPAVRQAAATLILQIDPPPRSAAPAVIAALKRHLAAKEGAVGDRDLADTDPVPQKGLPRSTGARRTSPGPGWVSPELAMALVKVAPPDEAVPLLVALLRRRSPASRSTAAQALADLGPAAHAAIPALVETMKEAILDGGRSATGYGSRTARALGRIAPGSTEVTPSSPDVVAVLAEALQLPPASIRSNAAEALGKFGPRAAPAMSGLRGLLEDRDRRVREAAEDALKKIESKSTPTPDDKAP